LHTVFLLGKEFPVASWQQCLQELPHTLKQPGSSGVIRCANGSKALPAPHMLCRVPLCLCCAQFGLSAVRRQAFLSSACAGESCSLVCACPAMLRIHAGARAVCSTDCNMPSAAQSTTRCLQHRSQHAVCSTDHLHAEALSNLMAQGNTVVKGFSSLISAGWMLDKCLPHCHGS